MSGNPPLQNFNDVVGVDLLELSERRRVVLGLLPQIIFERRDGVVLLLAAGLAKRCTRLLF